MLTMMGKISADDIVKYFFFLFFLDNTVWHFMQIVFRGVTLREMANTIFLGNKKYTISLSPAE